MGSRNVPSCFMLQKPGQTWAHMQAVLFDAQIFLHLCKRAHVMWAPTTSNLKASTLSNVGRLRQVSDTIFLCKLNLLHVYDYRLARDNCPTMIHSGQHLRVLTESLYLSKYLPFSTVQTVVLFVRMFVRQVGEHISWRSCCQDTFVLYSAVLTDSNTIISFLDCINKDLFQCLSLSFFSWARHCTLTVPLSPPRRINGYWQIQCWGKPFDIYS